MKRSSLSRLCYGLLVACIPASMLCVVYLPAAVRAYADKHAHGLYLFMDSLFVRFPSWGQYFAVQTLTAALIVVAVLWWAGQPDRSAPPPAERGRRSLLGWPHLFPVLVGAYAVWAGLTYFWSIWPYGTRAYYLRELPFYFLAVAAMYLLGREKRWITVAVVFWASALLEVLLQIGVNTVVAVSTLKAYAAKDLAAQAWSAKPDSPISFWTPFSGALDSKAVFFSNRNWACPIMITAALIAAGFLADWIARRRAAGSENAARPSWFIPVAAAFSIALFGGMLYVVHSLAGFIATGVAVVAYVLCVAPIKRKALITVALLAVVGAGSLTVVASETLWNKALRKALDPNSTAHLRVLDILAGKELYVRRPLQGWGMGAWPASYWQFAPPLAGGMRFTKNLRSTHPHNEIVRIAADQGLVGLVLYGAVLAYALAAGCWGLRRQGRRLRLIGYAFWAGVLAFFVQGIFDKAPMSWSFGTNFWLLLGLLSSGYWLARAPEPARAPDKERLRMTPNGWVLVALVAGGVGWAWWVWGVGGYAGMVYLRRANDALVKMGSRDEEEAQKYFALFKENLEKMRPRLLWADEILNCDYAECRFLKDRAQWGPALALLERMQKTAPEFLKTRLYLAECYMHTGRTREGLANLEQFIARNPYELEAYNLFFRVDRARATQLLESHVVSRLTANDPVVQDYATKEEALTLLDYYVHLGTVERARSFFQLAQRVYASGQSPRPVNAAALIVKLDGAYRKNQWDDLAVTIEGMFPEVLSGSVPRTPPVVPGAGAGAPRLQDSTAAPLVP